MADIKNDINTLTDALSPRAVEEINKALSEIKIEEGWQETAMGVLIETVDNYGVEGISKARDLLWNVIEGKEFDQEAFNALTLRKQSDLLRDLQNQEAEKKNKAKDFAIIVGNALGGVLVAVAKGIVAKSI